LSFDDFFLLFPEGAFWLDEDNVGFLPDEAADGFFELLLELDLEPAVTQKGCLHMLVYKIHVYQQHWLHYLYSKLDTYIIQATTLEISQYFDKLDLINH